MPPGADHQSAVFSTPQIAYKNLNWKNIVLRNDIEQVVQDCGPQREELHCSQKTHLLFQ